MNGIRLGPCLQTATAEGLARTLIGALARLPRGSLPLHAGCTQGGRVDDSDLTITLLGVDRTQDSVVARVGVFFTEVVGGCNCSDDPVAVNAYCELRVSIDPASGLAGVHPCHS